jgi:RimJ/RimL family protein N-acetyltransferase
MPDEPEPSEPLVPGEAKPGPSDGPAAGAVVRAMRASDVDAALDMFAEVAAEGLWLGTEAGFDRARRREAWLAGLDDPSLRSLVVEDAATGRLLGNGSVHLARYGVAEVGMALAEEARGQGIGGRLLDALIGIARDLGAHKVDLQVWPHNERALRLYLSRGFRPEGRLRSHYRRSSGQVWDAILMGLVLDTGAVARAGGSGLPDAACLPASLDLRESQPE